MYYLIRTFLQPINSVVLIAASSTVIVFRELKLHKLH